MSDKVKIPSIRQHVASFLLKNMSDKTFFVTYEDLQSYLASEGVDVSVDNLHDVVNDIGRACYEADLPMLDCFVVNSDTSLPDEDFFNRAQSKYENIQRVE